MDLKTSYCQREKKPCMRWVEEYFQDCLCNIKDEISFAFGIASLICWGVAEIPQIVTNFKNKSGHGVSLAFLCTWIVGDIFNLVGCILEPATLPTQFYTAVLYTATTVILFLQCLYYDYFLQWWKCRRHIEVDPVKDHTKLLNPKPQTSAIAATNSPVQVPQKKDYYYTSARSLAGSETPPFLGYMKANSVPSALGHDSDDQSTDDEAFPVISMKYASLPRSIPRPGHHAGYYGTFLASSMLPRSNALTGAFVTLSGRRFQQEHGSDNSLYGEGLGWLMAVIYMGGRIPQIWLNIKRGSVEGLNPLMFILALVANATYVGSILVRSTEWSRIRANMPWLLDAIVCVALDLFIIMQYIYYKYYKVQRSTRGVRDHRGDYIEPYKQAEVS